MRGVDGGAYADEDPLVLKVDIGDGELAGERHLCCAAGRLAKPCVNGMGSANVPLLCVTMSLWSTSWENLRESQQISELPRSPPNVVTDRL